MPDWSYLLVTLVYNLSLAVWIGGGFALGALAAPTLFSKLERPQAGELFGGILRKFSRVRLFAIAAVIVVAFAKYLKWESHAAEGHYAIWIGIRWIAIAVMAGSVLYEIFYLERAIMTSRENGASRAEFDRLHRRAELLMKVSLAAAVVALLLN